MFVVPSTSVPPCSGMRSPERSVNCADPSVESTENPAPVMMSTAVASAISRGVVSGFGTAGDAVGAVGSNWSTKSGPVFVRSAELNRDIVSRHTSGPARSRS